MNVRLAVDYEVEDERPEAEKFAAEVIRAETDVFVEVVKKRLAAAGLDVKGFRAEYS